MKSIFLLGGLAGFSLATLTGLLVHRPWDLILRDAALACLVGALLFSWFWSFVVAAFTDLHRTRVELANKPPAPVPEPAPAPVAPAPSPAPRASAPRASTLTPPPAAARAR